MLSSSNPLGLPYGRFPRGFPINKLTNRLTNRLTNQSPNQPTNLPTYLPTYLPTNNNSNKRIMEAKIVDNSGFLNECLTPRKVLLLRERERERRFRKQLRHANVVTLVFITSVTRPNLLRYAKRWLQLFAWPSTVCSPLNMS
jgi:hypothetical protein